VWRITEIGKTKRKKMRKLNKAFINYLIEKLDLETTLKSYK